jgi:hypothetical protein
MSAARTEKLAVEFADKLCDLMEDLDVLIEMGLIAVQYDAGVRRYGITPKGQLGRELMADSEADLPLIEPGPAESAG